MNDRRSKDLGFPLLHLSESVRISLSVIPFIL